VCKWGGDLTHAGIAHTRQVRTQLLARARRHGTRRCGWDCLAQYASVFWEEMLRPVAPRAPNPGSVSGATGRAARHPQPRVCGAGEDPLDGPFNQHEYLMCASRDPEFLDPSYVRQRSAFLEGRKSANARKGHLPASCVARTDRRRCRHARVCQQRAARTGYRRGFRRRSLHTATAAVWPHALCPLAATLGAPVPAGMVQSDDIVQEFLGALARSPLSTAADPSARSQTSSPHRPRRSRRAAPPARPPARADAACRRWTAPSCA
jgi:hypothetical protein